MKNEYVVEAGLRDLIILIKKRFYILIGITLLSVIIATVYSLYISKPVYEVKTSVMIGSNNKDEEKTHLSDLILYQKMLKTYGYIVKTNEVAKKAIERVDLDTTSEELIARITVIPNEDTLVLDIKLIGDEPQKVIDTLNAISSIFIEEVKGLYPEVNLQVIDKSKLLASPIKTNIKQNLAFSFAFGMILSISLICLIQYLDNSITTKEEVEKCLNIPVIGLMPREKGGFQSIDFESLNVFNYSSVEAYRTLRTNIDFTAAEKNIKVIAITSSIEGEGKTTIASMLSVIMAQAGKKVILVDCDFRRSMVHKLFNLNNVSGLSNILNMESTLQACTHKSIIKNLYVLAAGTKPSNPAELLSTDMMKRLIANLKEEYDYVFIDTPAVGLVTDAQLISQISDGCLMVVASGKIDERSLVSAKRLLQHVNATILGISVNKIIKSKNYYRTQYYGTNIKTKIRNKRKKSNNRIAGETRSE